MRNIIAPPSSKWIERPTLGKVCKRSGRQAHKSGVQQLHKTLPSAKLGRNGIERNDSTRRTVDNDSARRQTRIANIIALSPVRCIVGRREATMATTAVAKQQQKTNRVQRVPKALREQV